MRKHYEPVSDGEQGVDDGYVSLHGEGDGEVHRENHCRLNQSL